jgi:Xaa-Pro aminopeptidase
MTDAALGAIMVLGDVVGNPPMRYLTGGVRVSNAVLVKKVGAEPVMYCNAMERDEAAKSGLRTTPLEIDGVESLLKDPRRILSGEGIEKGRLGLHGTLDVGNLLAVAAGIRGAYPELEVVGEKKDESIFLRAMETKDETEIERIRRVGQVTTEVVGKVAEMLTGSDVASDEVLLKSDGSPLTVADVKKKISLWLEERGAEQPLGCVFAIGADAGVPHSVGAPEDQIRLGKTIVFDIFPNEAGGGYFYDFTRTWTLGYATAEAQTLYAEVREVYEKVIDNIDLNVPFKQYQVMVCDEFKKKGHNTPIHTEGVLEHGYVHALGHGLGLNIHERPWSRHTAGDDNIIRPGVVVTVEPGLYYPDRECGVRIEDTYWVRPDGMLERLAEYPCDLVLPMSKWRETAPGKGSDEVMGESWVK